tara:strand:+ start:88 stop:660 length:573 start_codon:yes stop_codon:yes gene_type:complete
MERFREHLYYKWESLFNLDDLHALHATINKKHEREFKDIPAEREGVVIKKATTKGIQWLHLKDLLTQLETAIKITNRDNLGYHLYDLFDTDLLLLNTYDAKDGSEYKWHKDAETNKAFDIKFTVLINASIEPYEGGTLQLFTNGGAAEVTEMNKPGCVVMFKSDIPHRVLPVTSGIRRSITIFINGPKFV